MFSSLDLEHPVITNMRETGYPNRTAPKQMLCPVCLSEAEYFYTNKNMRIVGCCNCLTQRFYDEFEREDF